VNLTAFWYAPALICLNAMEGLAVSPTMR